ncbi:MAG: RsmE family RNA methyltransferase [Candidatus Krumholzibacteriales bacterium]
MAHRRYFYVRNDNITGETGHIDPDEAHHLLSVCRARKGDTVDLLDGEGGIYRAVITDFAGGTVEFRLLESRMEERRFRPDIAIAVIKGGRMDIAVEKCAEIGVGRIIPYRSSRTVWRGGGEDARRKRERLHRKVVAACKQSGQPFFPEVEEVVDFSEMLEIASSYHGIYLADRAGKKLDGPAAESSVGIVGPEGGLSAGERQQALAAGAVPVCLGDTRLRTETAAACMVFYLRMIGEEG